MSSAQSPTRQVHIYVQAGDDHPIVIPAYDTDNKTRVDLTGYTAKAQAVDYSGALVHTWTTADGSAVCNELGVELLTDDSDAWGWTNALFDVVATSPSGARIVPAGGRLTVRPLRTQL